MRCYGYFMRRIRKKNDSEDRNFMLKMAPIIDKELLNGLSVKIFNKPFAQTIGYVFFEGDTPIGISSFLADKKQSEIICIGILSEYRGRGLGDFFTRSILLRLSEVGERIVVDYPSGYFTKFGFFESDGKMVVDSKNLTFPSECGGK